MFLNIVLIKLRMYTYTYMHTVDDNSIVQQCETAFLYAP